MTLEEMLDAIGGLSDAEAVTLTKAICRDLARRRRRMEAEGEAEAGGDETTEV